MENSAINDGQEENIHDKISSMMYGFGDSSTRNPETVKLVENTVRKQIREMLENITSNNNGKNYKIIKSEDIIFYLRKNRKQVQRLLKYIYFKYNDLRILHKQENNKKLAESIKQFVDLIDETTELSDTSAFDAVKHSRMLRAQRISTSLNDDKYLEYAKARRTSFIHVRNRHDSNKFKQWIDPHNDYHLRGGAIEMISFIAYGIVGNLTDMALIIRENNTYQASNPLDMKVGHYHNSMMFNVPHITSNMVNKGLKPITVDEMYEVIRRCYMPQVGYLRFSNKSILGKRKLCY